MTLTPALRGTNPFEAAGVWLKCALHTHTTVSDGEVEHARPGARLRGRGVRRGGDHRPLAPHAGALHRPVADGSRRRADVRRRTRTRGRVPRLRPQRVDRGPGGGLRENWITNEEEHWEQRTFPDFTTANRWAAGQGAVTYAAHPDWSGLDPSVLLGAEGLAGLEVYNGTSEVGGRPRGLVALVGRASRRRHVGVRAADRRPARAAVRPGAGADDGQGARTDG